MSRPGGRFPGTRTEDTTVDHDSIEELLRAASAAAGRPLVPRVEAVAKPVREAVERIASELSLNVDAYRLAYAPRAPYLGYAIDSADEQAASWTLVSIWLTGFAHGALDSDASLLDAERWFYADLVESLPSLAPATRPFTQSPAPAAEVRALLPYLLDSHASGTRRAVLRDRTQSVHQRVRRRNGVYYTPGDVARLMLTTCASARSQRIGSLLDPAVGTGVFPWVAALMELVDPTRLYGIDRDAAIAERTATTLTAATLPKLSRYAPWSVWHIHRMNVATFDSLTIRRSANAPTLNGEEVRESARQKLLSGGYVEPATDSASVTELADIFPELAAGAELVVSNPPYARMGAHCKTVHANSFEIFSSAPPKQSTNAYLPFVELATKLANPERGAISLVVPLALGFDSGKHTRNLRQLLSSMTGGWEYRFFDRMPDALFGDDIKTRNCIATWTPSANGSATTPLLRWRSTERTEFLASPPRATKLATDITDGVPKLGSVEEAAILARLRGWPLRLRSVSSLTVHAPRDFGHLVGNDAVIAIAPTAYNWLNVVRDPSALLCHGHNALSGYAVLEFKSSTEASAGYAVLSSRVTYWLWRVLGDGFHVTNGFLLSLPWPYAHGPVAASPDARASEALSELPAIGEKLWSDALSARIQSVNRGLTSIAFPANGNYVLLDQLDEALFRNYAVPDAEAIDLNAWYRRVVSLNDNNDRRLVDAH